MNDPTKLNYVIKSFIENKQNLLEIIKSLSPKDSDSYNIALVALKNMINFSNVEFSKAINLNPNIVLNGSHSEHCEESKNPFAHCKYELVRLGEHIIENPKSKIKVGEAKENTSGLYPFYTSGLNIYRYDEALVNGENIYLSTGGNAIVQFYNGDSAYSTDTYVFKSKNINSLLTKFIFYILETQINYIDKYLFKGMGLKHLQKTEFKELQIPLPPIEIQKQIVEECEKVEEQYNTIKMSIEEYQKLIKAILVKCGICEADASLYLLSESEESQAFKDSAFRDISASSQYDENSIDTFIARLLAYIAELESKLNWDFIIACHSEALAEESHNAESQNRHIEGSEAIEISKNLESFRDSSLVSQAQNDNYQNTTDTKELSSLLESLPTPPPNGWELKKLGEMAEISRGASPRPISKFLTDDKNGVNWIKIGDVAQGSKYITQTKEKITQKGADKSKSVRKGDFIISNSMSVGRPYILRIDGCIHDGWLLLSNITDSLNKEFLYYALISDDAQKQFQEKAVGSLVENLNIDRVKQIKIPLPPLESQQKIVQVVEAIESKITQIDSALESLENEKAEILNRILSNERERERERRSET